MTTKQVSAKAQTYTVDYELHSLGWKAFQDLCITIVSEIFGQTVQTFCDSHDGGRDGAFRGTWNKCKNESFDGSFTVQCKFTAKPNQKIRKSDLTDEIEKARRLADHGLANTYLLFTNACLTGTNEEKIRASFESLQGISHFSVYGSERISQMIRESPRLRMLVPRIYGLGDLSQILDERAYAQAREILSVQGDDLAKFVITDAYRKSAKALSDHGFVLLLGDPASGKSTIAAALAVAALDRWQCPVIKVLDAEDFVKHSNPNEPKQFFWIDDAFGTTQCDVQCIEGWNRAFPHLCAAIKRGARVLFTSRNYVYIAAQRHMKESSFPLLQNSQVRISVESLTLEEKQQILYNHIRCGSQGQDFKQKIKPFLSDAAALPRFNPEVARRLGTPLFTEKMSISQDGVHSFVEHPLEWLREIIQTLDSDSRSALALVFMRRGALPSPIEMTAEEERAITRLNGSAGGISNALIALKGSLLIQSLQDGNYVWRFKHPTIHDAFAALVDKNSELLDIYLAGVSLEMLFREVSCGDVGIEGVKVVVPRNRYDIIVRRIESFDIAQWKKRLALHRFLSHRCGKGFLELLIDRAPQFVFRLGVDLPDVAVLVRLYEFGLLPETKRRDVVNEAGKRAVKTPDSGFLRPGISKLLTSEEREAILEQVANRLLPYLADCIEAWRDDWRICDDPEEHFSGLERTLKDYRLAFADNEDAVTQIEDGLEMLESITGNLLDQYYQELPETLSYFPEDTVQCMASEGDRSIFEDVDH